MPAQRIGDCHICGLRGPLSFEHVPPRKAFNDRPIIRANFQDVVGIGPDEPIRGENQQRGLGDYTLCPRCNNNTGGWYGNEFVKWCYQGFNILAMSQGKPSLIYMYYLLPLRIIKQIVVMFFSVNGPEFRQANPELVSFVLDKERKNLSPYYRIYTYYTVGNRLRCSGTSGILNTTTHEVRVFSEITYFPFGYVMTLDTRPPDSRLVDITHFAKYGINEFAIESIRLPVLPIHLWFPGDYRTRDEILARHQKK